LETLVFNELKRRGKEIYFYKQKQECDFLVKEHLQISQAIQVSKTLKDPETKQRELQGLLEAMNTYNLSQGLILTFDEEGAEKIQQEGKHFQITILPIWKWLLSY